jgi:hypothetical protein
MLTPVASLISSRSFDTRLAAIRLPAISRAAAQGEPRDETPSMLQTAVTEPPHTPAAPNPLSGHMPHSPRPSSS